MPIIYREDSSHFGWRSKMQIFSSPSFGRMYLGIHWLDSHDLTLVREPLFLAT